jgi:hypothetical protein
VIGLAACIPDGRLTHAGHSPSLTIGMATTDSLMRLLAGDEQRAGRLRMYSVRLMRSRARHSCRCARGRLRGRRGWRCIPASCPEIREWHGRRSHSHPAFDRGPPRASRGRACVRSRRPGGKRPHDDRSEAPQAAPVRDPRDGVPTRIAPAGPDLPSSFTPEAAPRATRTSASPRTCGSLAPPARRLPSSNSGFSSGDGSASAWPAIRTCQWRPFAGVAGC